MDLYTINYIKNNELIYHYLRDNSYWYKYLNRDEKYLKEIEEEAKKFYEVRIEDRIKRFKDSLDMVSNFLDVLK